MRLTSSLYLLYSFMSLFWVSLHTNIVRILSFGFEWPLLSTDHETKTNRETKYWSELPTPFKTFHRNTTLRRHNRNHILSKRQVNLGDNSLPDVLISLLEIPYYINYIDKNPVTIISYMYCFQHCKEWKYPHILMMNRYSLVQ